MNRNKQGQVGLPCSHRRHSHARSCLYSHRVHLCLVCSSSFGFEGHACLRVRDQKCVCALMSLSWRREETEGSGVMRTSTLGVCACACGDRERIEALVCIMERELSQLLGAFICLLQHQDTHALFLLAHRPNQTSCNLSFGCDLARQRWVTFSSWLYGNPSL